MTFEVTILDHPAPVTISPLVVNRQDAHLLGEFAESGRRDPRLATVLLAPELKFLVVSVVAVPVCFLAGYAATRVPAISKVL
jgi:hypothetical protein